MKKATSVVNTELEANMSLLKTQLETLRSTADIVDVYREGLCTEGITGRVLAFSEHVVLLQRFDDAFRDEGITAIRPDDVTRLRFGDRELALGSRLAPARGDVLIDSVTLLELTASATVLGRTHGCVTLYLEGVSPDILITGRVLEVDDDYLLLEQWGTPRSLDKYTTLLRGDSLTRVDAGSSYQRLLSNAHKIGP